MTHAAMKWGLEDANSLTRWDDRISVLEQYSFFRGISLDQAWGEQTVSRIREIDEQKLMSGTPECFGSG